MIPARAVVPLIVLSLAAGVLSLAVAVRVILVRVHAGAAAEELPALTVEAVYPGATASVAEEKLAAPLEDQIMGVEHLRQLRSRCGRDGSYRLEVSFTRHRHRPRPETRPEPGRGRYARAAAEIQRLGLTVRKPSPGLLMLICLYSRDASVNAVDLNNYANVMLKHELARVPGVSQVTLLGAEDFGVRIRLDLDKLAARELTIEDVTRAVDSQDLGRTTVRRPDRRHIPPPAECADAGADG